MLTVVGRVSGLSSGQVEVQVGSLVRTTEITAGTETDTGQYRLTLMSDLPDLTQFSVGQQVSAKLTGADPVVVTLSELEISSGLVEMSSLEIVSEPQIGVVDRLGVGQVYVGLKHQRQLQISNGGNADLVIGSISSLSLIHI